MNDVTLVGRSPPQFVPGEVLEDDNLIEEDMLIKALEYVEDGIESNITIPSVGQMYESFEDLEKAMEEFAEVSGFEVGKSTINFNRKDASDLKVLEKCFSEMPSTQSIVKRGYFYCIKRNEQLVKSLKLENGGRPLTTPQRKLVQCTFRIPFKFDCNAPGYVFIL